MQTAARFPRFVLASPILASIFTLALFAGGYSFNGRFIAKISYEWLVHSGIVGWSAYFRVLGSSISIYFYLRTIISMFRTNKNLVPFDAKMDWGQRTGGIVVSITAILILVIGIVPNPLMYIAQLTKLVWAPV